MKKQFYFPLLAILAFVLTSWGGAGHKTVATIAYNHLTPQAKETVGRFLGDTTMADVSSWADQVLREPEYKNTAPQHYANVPLGLSYEQFQKEITNQDKDNVYKAIERNKAAFISPTSTKQQRLIALKFLIHFVGDLHQPLHVSRAEDKGGNTIQLQYEGKGTNMHSLWDSKLIGSEGKSFEQMSIDYDKATRKQIKQWQSDPVIKWMWESYQISSKLYPEIEQNNKLDESYYKSHINIVNERIEMAGIRLAGLLNELSKSLQFKADVYTYGTITRVEPRVFQAGDSSVVDVPLNQLISFANKGKISTEGKVYGYKEFANFTLVNIGAAYPNQLLTLKLNGKAKSIALSFEGKNIRIIGKVITYRDMPEIEISDPLDIIIK